MQNIGECVIEYYNRSQTIGQNSPHKEHKRFTVLRFIFGFHQLLRNDIIINKSTDLDTAHKLAQQAENGSLSKYAKEDEEEIA